MTVELHEIVCSPTTPTASPSSRHNGGDTYRLEPAPAISSEDRLLAWCDQWVARNPIAGDVVAYGSLTLTALLIALAVVFSSR